MQAIYRLKPPGLLNLDILARLIYLLEELMLQHIHDATKVLKLARLMGRLGKQDRENRNFNLNLKVKMWVMQCPHRIAWARAMIGERAIKHWLERYDRATAQVVDANQAPAIPTPKRQTTRTKRETKHENKSRNYQWKRFALFKITDFVTEPFCEHLIRAEHASPNWLQPREARVLKPVQFHPCELVPEAATGAPAPEGEKLQEENAKPEQSPEQSRDPTSDEHKKKPP